MSILSHENYIRRFNYEMSWATILLHENHMFMMIQLWNVMDVNYITWGSYTYEASSMKCDGYWFSHMRNIYIRRFNYEISWMSNFIVWESYTKNQSMKYHGFQCYHVQRIILWKSWMTMLTHDNHMYTKNQTMKSHGCWCYHMRIIYEESNYDMTVSWMSILSHENHKYTKNQLKSHGCWCNHMRIINNESNYDMSVSWMSMLSHGNHVHTRKETMKVMDVDVIIQESCTKNQTMVCQYHGCWCYHMRIICIRRIKLREVMDVDVITWESYTMNQTMICQYHGCRYYHMRKTYEESNYNTSLPCSYYCMCNMADVKFILRNQMDNKCLWLQYWIWIQDSRGYSGVLLHHLNHNTRCKQVVS